MAVSKKESKPQPVTIPEFVSLSKQALQVVWGNHRLLSLAQVLLLVSGSLLSFARLGVLALLINRLISDPTLDATIWMLVALVVITQSLPTFIYTLQGHFNKILYLKLEAFIEMEATRIYSKLDVAQLEDPEIKNLMNRALQEGQWRVKNFAERYIYLANELVSTVVAAGLLTQVSWWALPVLVLATLPELIVSNRYSSHIWSISSDQSERRRFFWNLNSHFSTLPYLIELKLSQNLLAFQKRMSRLFDGFLKEQIANERTKLKETTLAELLSQFGIGLVVVVLILRAVSGDVQVGTLAFLFSVVTGFRGSISGLFMTISGQYEDVLFVRDFFTLRRLAPGLPRPKHPVVLPRDKTPRIEFVDVSFTYPGTSAKILDRVSFVIEPGSSLALVGKNGAGKTSIVKLLCRFYDPTSGSILIDGHNLKTLDIESWYWHMGVLFQEYARYNFQAFDAIAVGRPKRPSRGEVYRASKLAGSHEFISGWVDRYRQQLGRDFTKGIEPSIGQWQKLALARVWYRRPTVFILDEPTASLDAEAEAAIFTRLEAEAKKATTILISHRFSSVKKADQIIVIENGRIRERGTHRQLMAKPKTYARLFELQAKEFREHNQEE